MFYKEEVNKKFFNVTPLLAMSLGIKDSVNPFGISVLLLFLMVVFYCAVDISRTFKSGISFLAFFIAFTFLSIGGFLDGIFLIYWVNNTILVINWIIAILLIICGLVCFVDWARARFLKKEDFMLGVPAFFRSIASEAWESEKQVKPKNILIIAVSSLFGLIAAIHVTTWPEDANIYMLFYSLYTEGSVIKAFAVFVLYCFSYVLPMIVVLMSAIFLLSRKKKVDKNGFASSIAKMLFSALMLAGGIGLVFVMV